VRFPESLSLSDLISIVSVAVTIALAWGYFGARITALEKEVIAIRADVDKTNSQLDRLSFKVQSVESHVHDHSLFIDQLFNQIKQPVPRRSYESTPTPDQYNPMIGPNSK
jgi:hypothetical protein